ncbi:MAG: hypothetical protein ACI9JY_001743 [Saprospiraceae bacterium]|jgi:hypothetical protein
MLSFSRNDFLKKKNGQVYNFFDLNKKDSIRELEINKIPILILLFKKGI